MNECGSYGWVEYLNSSLILLKRWELTCYANKKKKGTNIEVLTPSLSYIARSRYSTNSSSGAIYRVSHFQTANWDTFLRLFPADKFVNLVCYCCKYWCLPHVIPHQYKPAKKKKQKALRCVNKFLRFATNTNHILNAKMTNINPNSFRVTDNFKLCLSVRMTSFPNPTTCSL